MHPHLIKTSFAALLAAAAIGSAIAQTAPSTPARRQRRRSRQERVPGR